MRQILAEFFGTFGLVFVATGVVVVNSESGGALSLIGIAIATGLVVMAMIYAIGHISGAHINPAVTIAFAAARHFPTRLVPAYLGAQFFGAILASLTVRALFGDIAHLGATIPTGSAVQSVFLEFLLALILMLVIMAVATDVRSVGQAAAIAVGGTIGLEVMFGGPISGASMNPARSFAPALVSWTWVDQWIYFVGPIAGALTGALIYLLLRGEVESTAEELS